MTTRKQFAFTNDEGEFIKGEFPNVVKTYPLPDEVVTAVLDTLTQALIVALLTDDPKVRRATIKTLLGLRQDLGFSPKGE